MANCRICSQAYGIKSPEPGVCKACYENPNYRVELQVKVDAIDNVILTTETQSDLKIVKRIEVISAEVAYGMNIFKDLFADVRNIVGGRSKAVQNTMRDARRAALYELKREAHEIGANAVVGVDLDYVELSAHSTMVMLVATGTAVVIEEA